MTYYIRINIFAICGLKMVYTYCFYDASNKFLIDHTYDLHIKSRLKFVYDIPQYLNSFA